MPGIWQLSPQPSTLPMFLNNSFKIIQCSERVEILVQKFMTNIKIRSTSLSYGKKIVIQGCVEYAIT